MRLDPPMTPHRARLVNFGEKTPLASGTANDVPPQRASVARGPPSSDQTLRESADRPPGRGDGHLTRMRIHVGEPLSTPWRAGPAGPSLNAPPTAHRDGHRRGRPHRAPPTHPEVVGRKDRVRAPDRGHGHQPPDTVTALERPGVEPTQVHRSQRRNQPPAAPDHRTSTRAHGPRRREEGRPHPRRGRLALARTRRRADQGRRASQEANRTRRLRLSPLRRRRVQPPCVHRSYAGREGRHSCRVPPQGTSLVRCPRHHPHRTHRDRQRQLPIATRLRRGVTNVLASYT